MTATDRFMDSLIDAVDAELGIDELRASLAVETEGEHVLARSEPEPDYQAPPALLREHRSLRTRRRVLGVMAVVLAAAATDGLVWRWSGANASRDLSFERSFTVVFDPVNYSETNRTTAIGRIGDGIKQGISALLVARGRAEFAEEAERCLTLIESQLDRGWDVPVDVPFEQPTLGTLVEEITTGAADDTALRDLSSLMLTGLKALNYCREQPGFVGSLSRAFLDKNLPPMLAR